MHRKKEIIICFPEHVYKILSICFGLFVFLYDFMGSMGFREFEKITEIGKNLKNK